MKLLFLSDNRQKFLPDDWCLSFPHLPKDQDSNMCEIALGFKRLNFPAARWLLWCQLSDEGVFPICVMESYLKWDLICHTLVFHPDIK